MLESFEDTNKLAKQAKTALKNLTKFADEEDKRLTKEAKERDEELVKQQVQRQKAVKERAKLDREIQDLHSKRETLKQEHEAGKIKKAEFDRLDKEYKDALEAKNKVKKAIKFGLTIIGAGGISKLLS